MQASRPSQETIATVIGWLKRGFDATATWVTQLSWWKFFLFAAVALLAASILEDKLFSGPPPIAQPSARAPMQRPSGEGAIIIDDSGIRYSPGKRKNDASSTPPADSGEIHIGLPPQISEGISDAIEAAVAAKVEEKSKDYHEQASTWFKSFVFLLVLAMFATKALVGGKQRAEAQTQSANAAAERASMQRQLSETRMQMMQAQVEPHFLFNTLASVEYLIETDPPRASAMQHSLIQYLRAVLPQMRDNAVVTNLGREADMVGAYLSLLKMRMEERLHVDMRIPAGLRSAAFPPMMLQSMVENAIKHGLECKAEGGTLTIFAEVAHYKLRVTVSDDGAGFGVFPSDGTGLGLPTIRERLMLLHGDQASLHIEANSPHGVRATIEVPYQLSK